MDDGSKIVVMLPIYAVKRSQKRYIARRNMEAAGIKHCCRHSYTSMNGAYTRVGSEFSQKWRDYVKEVPYGG